MCSIAAAVAARKTPARGLRGVRSWARSSAACSAQMVVVVMSSTLGSRGAPAACCCPHSRGRLSPPLGEGRPYSVQVTVRVVFADDNYLVREGVAGLLDEAAEVELLETVADPVALLAAVASTGPTRCSPTSGCRPPSPPRASRPPSGSARSSPRPACSCSRSTSRTTTPSTCSSDGVEGLGYLLKERVTAGRRAGRGAARRRARRLRAGPEGRRGAAGAQVQPGQLTAARTHRARARGPPGACDRAAATPRPRRRCS